MELYTIFFNQWERLRSGWRVLLFIVINYVLALAVLVLVIAASRLFFNSLAEVQGMFEGLGGWIIQPVVILTAATVGGLLCGKLLEGLPARALGWTLHRGWFFDLLRGSLVGSLSLGLAALVSFLSGGYQFSIGTGGASAIFKTLFISGIIFIIAASAEEALFRGYPLQTMTRARLIPIALILTSLVFAYIHKENPNNPPGFAPFTYIGLDFINLPFINTALAGVWLAVGYLRTRSLWFPLGLHWSWNWTMGALLGLPVSGIERLTPAPLMRAASVGPVWLTGGTYGVEGGAACTLALIISTIFIWRTRLLSATPEMMSLTDKENPKAVGVTAPGMMEERSAAGEEQVSLKTNS
jgi:uncharacterized protein